MPNLAEGKGYTVRWVWRKPEANPCTEAHTSRLRRGGRGKLAWHGEPVITKQAVT